MKVRVKRVKNCVVRTVPVEAGKILDRLFGEHPSGVKWRQMYDKGEIKGYATESETDFALIKMFLRKPSSRFKSICRPAGNCDG